ncbi:MAG TPA: S41 family peptidase [Puia sp.]|nr:S41 family peptidase [Puia sp.]
MNYAVITNSIEKTYNRVSKKGLYLFWIIFLSVLVVSCGTSKKAFDPGRKYSPEVLRHDYMLFRHILEDLHPSLYWYTPRDSMNYFFDKGYAAITDSMTEPQFRTVLSYVIAKVDCGHTSVRSSKAYYDFADTAKLPQFPLILKWWKDTMVVSANLNRKDTILRRGTVIQSINGRSASQLTDTLFNYIVTDGYSLTGKYQYLSTGFNFSYWYKQVFGLTPTFTITYFDSARQLRETVIPLYDPRADTFRRVRLPLRSPEGVRRPGLAREPNRKERKRREELFTRNLVIDSTNTTGFMTLNTFEHGNHLVKFFRQSFRELSEKHVQNLVIDVRTNGGGDATNSTLLTRYLIDKKFKVADSLYAIRRHSKYDRYIQNSFLYRILMDVVSSKRADGKYHFGYFERHVFSPLQRHHFSGSVYILTGGNSFSATCLFAGALKGQKNVTIVGEETGGGYYGNTAWMIPDVTLPGTKLRFRLPRFRLIVNKDREKDGRGVIPDVPALPTSDAILKGFDFKTAKARELIQLHAVGKK